MTKHLQAKGIPGRRRIMLATIGSLLVDLIAFTIILPLFPSILENYKRNDPSGVYSWVANASHRLGILIGAPSTQSETVLIGGVLGSAFSFLQFLSSPIVGAVSDVKGRRISLLTCLVGIIGSHILWIFAQDFFSFVIARLVAGLARANVSICTTIVADDAEPSSRARGMALIGGAFSIGFTVGPALGAYYAKVGDFTTPAIISCVLSIASFLLVFAFVPETLPPEKRLSSDRKEVSNYLWPPYLFRFRAVSTGKKLMPLGLTFFIYMFFYSGLEFTLTFLTHQKLNYTPRDQGKMFAFMGVSMTFIQGVLTRRLKAGLEGPAATFGIFIMIPAFILVGFASEPLMLYAGLLCYSFGSGIVGPCLTSLAASQVANPNENGAAMGIFRSLGALARSFGPIVSAAMFWCYGPEVAYGMGALAILIPLLILRGAIQQEPKKHMKEK